MYQVNTVALHCPCLFHTVAIHSLIMLASYRSLFSCTFHTHLPFQSLRLVCRIKAIFLHDLDHLLDHVIMILPLLDQCVLDLPLILHVDDVYNYCVLLQKPVTPVHRLYEVIELIVNSNKYLPVTEPLEVTA